MYANRNIYRMIITRFVSVLCHTVFFLTWSGVFVIKDRMSFQGIKARAAMLLTNNGEEFVQF